MTRWLIEIDTCVFVGDLSARVRDAVWARICDNIGHGRASMAFSTNNEQRLEFRIHNTDWEPVDHDGIKLVRRNFPKTEENDHKSTKAMQGHIQRLSQRKQSAANGGTYVVLGVETTGLQEVLDIIEIAAVRVVQGEVKEQFSVLIRHTGTLPERVVMETGITDQMLLEQGIEKRQALEQLLTFCHNDTLVGHDIHFTIRSLSRSCKDAGLPFIRNPLKDTMRMARKKLDIGSYALEAVGAALSIEHPPLRRAASDALLTHGIFEKLKEI
ncbi:MAG: type I-E CRISPR-associated endoribonuclease Cas2 [Oscillospiraceae bacterium]|nr:type I-E CRISPR-associated endoribonuclease Cas2 [Oscillospiraceae bacterium]